MKHNASIFLQLGRAGANMETLEVISKIARQAKIYQKMAEYSCNGEGVLHGKKYTSGLSYKQIDNYYTPKGYISAYVDKDMEDTIFDITGDKAEVEIIRIIKANKHFKAEMQGDPRGACVRLYYKGVDCTELLY